MDKKIIITEGLKAVQLSTAVVNLLYSILLDNMPVKDSILLDSLVCICN